MAAPPTAPKPVSAPGSAASADHTSAAPAPAAKTKTFVPLAFETRALIDETDQPRELEATVHLSDGRITVSATNDPGNAVHSMPYDRVDSISYSKGRDPVWNSPDGPAPVARLGAGALGGIFRGTRHWVTLKTSESGDPFIVLRFGNEAQVKRAIAALEERTGRTAETVAPRKDAR